MPLIVYAYQSPLEVELYFLKAKNLFLKLFIILLKIVFI